LEATFVTILVVPFTVLPLEGSMIFTATELAVFTVTDALLTCRPSPPKARAEIVCDPSTTVAEFQAKVYGGEEVRY
jgi:hypothetical protein